MRKRGLEFVLAAATLVGCTTISCGLKDSDVFGTNSSSSTSGSSSSGSSSSGSGGSSSTSSASGSGLTGGGGQAGSSLSGGGGTGGCESDKKLCGEDCVSKTDPAYGCAGESCDPCDLEHAHAKCSVEGACVVDSCNNEGYDDCDLDGLSCETSLNTDYANCGECDNACSSTVTDGACVAGKCSGPCGEVVQTGWSICYELDHASYPNDYVGLAGGIVPPGGDIQYYFLDPWYGCVSTDSTKDYVTCAQGNLVTGTIMQFRAGIHDEPSFSTISGTIACDTTDCDGRCFVYQDGKEVGKLQNGSTSGLLMSVIQGWPPPIYDLRVTVP